MTPEDYVVVQEGDTGSAATDRQLQTLGDVADIVMG